MSNGLTWEIRSYITCRSCNVVYYLKYNMCDQKETYIGKTIGDNTSGFKSRMNQHISECRTGISSCHFPRHVFECGMKNNNLKEPFFEVNIMLMLKDGGRLETFERHLQQKGYDTLNRPK